MEEAYESRWQDLWTEACETFISEAGDPPSQNLEYWETCLLWKSVLAGLDKALAKRLKRQVSNLENEPLANFKLRTQRLVVKMWQRDDAQAALERAEQCERSGRWDEAREAYSEALLLGPSQHLQSSLRFSQLLHVMATSGGGEDGASEQVLRHVLTTSTAPTPTRKTLLARLIFLLLQQGREEEARPLFLSGGWKFCLASWAIRGNLDERQGTHNIGFPGCVFDGAIPSGFLQHLQDLFCPASLFWQEHGYNEVMGCGETGYFSYVQELAGETGNTLDLIIRHIWEFLKKEKRFPDLAEAKIAEWWAHKRPHCCGHQMHYDSDNEGIGGVRNPICSCIIFVNAPPGFGGPTLVTDQILSKKQLGSKGWLVTPSNGRLTAYDGTYFHGVVPGCGNAPASGQQNQSRRITFMIAFWKDIRKRPFGKDGLPGSSRPLPDPAEVLKVGGREYTWHQKLRLPLNCCSVVSSPVAVSPICKAPLWTDIGGKAVEEGVALPDIEECFQF